MPEISLYHKTFTRGSSEVSYFTDDTSQLSHTVMAKVLSHSKYSHKNLIFLMWNKILNNKKKVFKLNSDFVRLSQKPLKMGIFQTWELIYNKHHISSISTSKIIPCSFDLAQNSLSSLNRAKDRCSTKEVAGEEINTCMPYTHCPIYSWLSVNHLILPLPWRTFFSHWPS